MGIMMLAEVGFFHVFFDFSTWMLSVAAWAFLLLGFAIQLLLLKLCRKLWKRRIFAVLLIFGVVAGEVACQMITGWDLLVVLVLYGCVFSMVIGAIMACVIHLVSERMKR